MVKRSRTVQVLDDAAMDRVEANIDSIERALPGTVCVDEKTLLAHGLVTFRHPNGIETVHQYGTDGDLVATR